MTINSYVPEENFDDHNWQWLYCPQWTKYVKSFIYSKLLTCMENIFKLKNYVIMPYTFGTCSFVVQLWLSAPKMHLL